MTESTMELSHPFAELLGFTVTARTPGSCRVELPVRDHHFNPHGLVHGAVLYALADTAMGGALSGTLAEDQVCTTIEIKINYFRPWRSGTLVCDAELVNGGRTTATLQSDVFDGEGRHLARALGTFAIVPRPVTAR